VKKLQRVIAGYRATNAVNFQTQQIQQSHQTASTPTYRKFRRHPRPDENAPERPPSAYVIFSKEVRKEGEIANLSFTQMARIVGDRWQNLTPSSKEVYENRAQREKEKYNQQFSTYKKTESYRAYQAYLADFKAKHRARTSERSYRAIGLRDDEINDWAPDLGSLSADVNQIDQILIETEIDNPFTRGKPSSKAFQHAQPGSIVPHYTISRDFSGCNNDVATSILSYLGERENRKGDLSVLVRR
jgi:hypothetical protein